LQTVFDLVFNICFARLAAAPQRPVSKPIAGRVWRADQRGKTRLAKRMRALKAGVAVVHRLSSG
jgi:hypothetical protein